MKKIFLILLVLIFTILSCKSSFEENQIFPKIDYDRISEIEIEKYDSDYNQLITEKNKIQRFKNFFNDSQNYDNDSRLKLRNSRLKYFLRIKQKDKYDNITFQIYESEDENKVIIGFFDTIENQENMDYKKYHRFYIDSEIINMIKNIND